MSEVCTNRDERDILTVVTSDIKWKPAAIGILLDVSGSMRRSVEYSDENGGPWAKSIFQVIVDLIKDDLSNENKVFALAFGGISEKPIFDILGTVKNVQYQFDEKHCKNFIPANSPCIERIFKILEKNGARSIRKWVTANVVSRAVSNEMIEMIQVELESDPSFRDHFINDILPPSCRNWIPISHAHNPSALIYSWFCNIVQDAWTSAASSFKQATEEDIRKVVKKVKEVLPFKLSTELLAIPNAESVMTFQKALEYLSGCIGKEEFTDDRSKKLHKTLEPFIYGITPIFESLEISNELLKPMVIGEGKKKVLFVLSDGDPSDIFLWRYNDAFRKIKDDFLEQEVTVICCFVSQREVTSPKKLYSSEEKGWCTGAQFLFSLSSIIPTEILPRAILMKRGWDIDISDNETKLFMQVSHPKNIKEACDLAKDIACNQESLSYLLVSVPLDLYIDKTRGDFKAPKQEYETCYANASATVLHLAMNRILGRDGGYPNFEELRQKLISDHGKKGARTYGVLLKVCPQYRLHCKRVNLQGALEAITEKRQVVATFRLTDSELNTFKTFFSQTNPTGILTKKEIDISRRKPHEKLCGHAVVLTSFNSQCLRFMNSWGHDWGDIGFFRVKSSDVLDLTFIDVYWTLDDLSDREKAYFATHGSRVSQKLMDSLVGLQSQTYTCPLCGQTSPVTTFTGTLHCATCPICRGEFSCNGAGNILALNVYLTSLTR